MPEPDTDSESIDFRDATFLSHSCLYGSYIKYSADDVQTGDTMETVLVYNPLNNHIDDVMYRADTFLE